MFFCEIFPILLEVHIVQIVIIFLFQINEKRKEKIKQGRNVTGPFKPKTAQSF
jgi:hypothetical protein